MEVYAFLYLSVPQIQQSNQKLYTFLNQDIIIIIINLAENEVGPFGLIDDVLDLFEIIDLLFFFLVFLVVLVDDIIVFQIDVFEVLLPFIFNEILGDIDINDLAYYPYQIYRLLFVFINTN